MDPEGISCSLTCIGQTTGNISAPKYYILFHINDLPHIPPQKKKNPEKIPSKGHPRAHTLFEVKEKKIQISFSQYVNNVGTPLFRSMRQAQNTDTHALNQLWVSQKSSNFTADEHIWHPP